MLPFENMVADYVKETKGHVLYRVTPVFYQMSWLRAASKWRLVAEDNGESVCFNVFVYNVQPGISICYADGTSSRIAQGRDHRSFGAENLWEQALENLPLSRTGGV